jgi:hypothetical protein
VGKAETADREVQADGRFAWLSLLLAAWIFAALVLIIWALNHDLTHDIGISPYHVPFYGGLLALAALSAFLVLRAVRAGRRWHQAFPDGYGVLGAGTLVLLAWPIVDIGWREGIGVPDSGIESMLAPSRLLLPLGAILISCGPLRAALRSDRTRGNRWPAVVSAGFVYLALGAVGGFQPAQNPWLETAGREPQESPEIWVMNGDGTGQTRLIEAADGWEPQMPAWSPDGSQIAFVRVRAPERANTQSDDMDVWLASPDGTNQRLLVAGVGWQWLPHWSPDGAWIVYTVDPPGGPGQGAGLNAPAFGFGQGPAFVQPPSVSPEVDVWRVRADGTGTPERLTDAPSDDRAGAYSPDGRHILFDSTRSEGRTGVYVMEADGSNVVRVTFFGDDWGASWSPDGTRIAFHSSPTGGPADIYVTAYPEFRPPPLRLTDDPDNDLAPNWSPDGSRIAFQSYRADLQEIWSMAADGSDPRNLTRTAGVQESLTLGGEAWGPDGRILYGRAPIGPAWTQPLVRENLGVAAMLLEAIFLVLVVLLVVRVGSPFGAVAVVMGLGAAFAAVDGDDWRFLPAAIIGGLVVDLLIRLVPVARRPLVAGAGSAAAFVLSAGATVIVTAGLGWTPSLLLGVTLACAAIGWGLGGLIGRPLGTEARAVGEQSF